MTDFLCGIEIHQRLKTHKLFCKCQSKLGKETGQSYRRTMHTVRSELGKIDFAAEQEIQKDNQYVYRPTSNSCLVELDEEPPGPINRDAFWFALKICLAFKCRVADEIFVMRKTVLDGSNTSGFQRTALIGINGSMETSKGTVGIQSICLEEESAGILERETHGEKPYSLDRLGITLIELATAPDIKDYEHAKEVAERIGLTLRMLGVAERGLGTIRQDINVSVPGSERVEIKGVQELDSLPAVVENEVKRQHKMVEFYSKYRFGKTEEPVDLTKIISGMPVKEWIDSQFKQGAKAMAIKIENTDGLFGFELGTDRRIGTELSDYAKTAGVRGIIHSDEKLEKYGIDCDKVSEALGLGEKDGFVIVIGDEKRAREALKRVKFRAENNCTLPETRKVLKNNHSEYSRPLPGQHRMYPETDVQSIRINEEMLRQAAQGIPGSYDSFINRLEEELGDRETALRIAKSRNFDVYQELKEKFDKRLLVNSILNSLAALEGKLEFDAMEVTKKSMELFAEEKITKSAIPEVMAAIAQGKEETEMLRELGRIKDREELRKILAENGSIPEIMKRFGKRIDVEDLKALH